MAKTQHGGKRAGAGRKLMDPDERTTTVAVTLPMGLLEHLDAVAERKGWNRSQAVREAVQALVKRK